MANRTYLLALDRPFTSVPESPEIQSAVLAAASYMIPVFWYALFDETCIASRTVPGEDGSTVTYPVFQSARDDALARLESFERRALPLFASVPAAVLAAYRSFLMEAAGAWFAVDTAELWMMEESPVAEAGFRRCLHAVTRQPDLTAGTASLVGEWHDLLAQANIQLASAKPIETFALFGYSWGKPVPWEPTTRAGSFSPAPTTANVPTPASSSSLPGPKTTPAQNAAAFVCPACQKPLLSRHSPLCSFCSAKIPPELLFTPEQKKKIEADEQRAARQLAEREAERLQRSQSSWKRWPAH